MLIVTTQYAAFVLHRNKANKFTHDGIEMDELTRGNESSSDKDEAEREACDSGPANGQHTSDTDS